jgi:hypothetical protein
MSNDKMREEFEEAFHQARCQGICVAEDRSVAWAFFAASRESLVVELPDLERPTADGMSALFACKKALESLGLRVKP